jgi:hypothetical protein
MHQKTLLRVVAVLGGAALLVFAAWGALFVLLVGATAAQAPDPFVANGGPCCGHPDTWGEVTAGVGWTLGYVVVDALLVCLGIALVVWAARGRWPRRRRLASIPAGGLTAAVAVLAVILVPQLDE